MTTRFVLLPGMDGTGQLFAPFVDALPTGSEVSVASYPLDRTLSYAELQPYVKRAIPTGPYVLVAESFSGPLAVMHAAAGPANLRALVLCATFVANPMPSFLRWTRFLASRPVFRITPPKALVRALLTGADCKPQVLEAVIAACRQVQPSVMAHRLAQIFDVDVRAYLSSVGVPVLYVAALKDRLLGMRGLDQVSQHLPGLCSAIVDGPHLLLQCRPEETVRELLGFIARRIPR